jgi:hypothetical protein
MHSDAFRGFYTMLAHEHFPFDVLAAGELGRWAREGRLDRYCVVVLPDQPDLPPETAAALDAYVESGGRLLAAGRTGFAAAGRSCAAGPCALASLGLARAEDVLEDSRATYCMLDGEDTLEALPQTGMFFVHGPFARGKARAGVRALYPVQRGLYGPPEKVQWWDDPADSPVSGEYGAFHAASGAGESVFFPFDLGALYWRYQESAHRALVGHWVRRFLDAGGDRPHVGAHGAPLAVQLSAHRVGDTCDVLVHLVNYSGCQRSHFEMPIPVRGITLYGTGSPARVVLLRADVEAEVHTGPGDWSATVPELGLFEAVLVEEML